MNPPLPHPVLGEQGPLDALGVALGPRVGWPPPRAEEEERRVKERRGRRISAESRPRGTADVGWRGGLVEDLPPPLSQRGSERRCSAVVSGGAARSRLELSHAPTSTSIHLPASASDRFLVWTLHVPAVYLPGSLRCRRLIR